MRRLSGQSRGIGWLALGPALVVGGVLGVLVATVALGVTWDKAGTPGSATRWPRNANGLTYGSALNTASSQDEPDLIRVLATNGRTGYVLRSDLEPSPKSPEDALRQQAAQEGKDEVIPVYESDGIAKIGVFIVTHAAVGNGPAP